MARHDLTSRMRRAFDEFRKASPKLLTQVPVSMGVLVPGLVILGLLIVLGPALVGRGVLLDVDSLSARLPFRAMTGAVYSDAITCRKDTIDYFPAIAQIKQSLFRGDLPTWAPYEVGGAPLAALPNTGFLTPLALPYFLLPLWLAPAFVKLAEVVVALAGTVAFLRRRGVSWAGAWLAGFVFATSGFMIMWSNWPQTRVAALIPLLLWATDRVIDRHRARDAVVLAVVFASMLLGGFPAVTMYALSVAGVYALVRTLTKYRQRPWQALGTLATAVGGLVLGLGMAAVQMVPFVENLSASLSERNKGGFSLPLSAAMTLVAPSVRGTCRGGVWYGDVIPIEAIGYVGCGAAALAVLALGFRRRPREEPGIRLWLLGALVVFGWLIWIGGPLLTAWQQLPVIGNNSITRAQSIVGFVIACLVGLGFDRLTRRRALHDDDQSPTKASSPVGLADDGDAPVHSRSKRPTVTLIIAILVLVCVTVAAVMDAADGDYLGHLTRSLITPAVMLVIALAALSFVYAGPRRLATLGPLAVVVLVVVQGTVFAQTMLPLSQRDLFFPETPTHRFLQDHISHSRYGAGDGMMDAAISDWYHLRSPTGHEFTDPRWKDLLAAVDPDVQRTVTHSGFSRSLPFDRVASSPILDRLAVRYWTANPGRAVGSVGPVSKEGRVPLTQDEPASCRVDGGPMRGVNVYLVDEMPPAAPGATPMLHVQVSAGGETRTGSVLLDGSTRGPRRVTVAVAGEDLPGGGRATVRVSLTGTDDPRYLAGEGRRLSCSAVRPDSGTDQVRLVFSDSGSAVYERLDALPRVRWASRSQVVDPDQQVDALQAGVPDDTVLLDNGGSPAAEGVRGTVSIAEDGAERILVETESKGRGYLVVADSIVRPGWTARIDGERVPLVRADHAFAGVAVPPGRHRVELTYKAPGLHAGTVISAVSLLMGAALVGLPALLRRRRNGPEAGEIPEPSTPT